MRILACSDIHRNRKAAQAILDASRDADIVVGAGDFSTEGIGLSDTIDLFCAIAVPTILVAGNHDDLDELRGACRDSGTIHVLHGSGVNVRGLSFFGLGYEIPARRALPWNRRLDESEAAKLLRDCPQGAILVTHSPPLGVADIQRNGVHEGSQSVHDIVVSAKTQLHLCGHIHHAWGMSGTIGEFPIHNLGPTVNWFTV